MTTQTATISGLNVLAFREHRKLMNCAEQVHKLDQAAAETIELAKDLQNANRGSIFMTVRVFHACTDNEHINIPF